MKYLPILLLIALIGCKKKDSTPVVVQPPYYDNNNTTAPSDKGYNYISCIVDNVYHEGTVFHIDSPFSLQNNPVSHVSANGLDSFLWFLTINKEGNSGSIFDIPYQFNNSDSKSSVLALNVYKPHSPGLNELFTAYTYSSGNISTEIYSTITRNDSVLSGYFYGYSTSGGIIKQGKFYIKLR